MDINTEGLDVFMSSAEFRRWFDRCVAFTMSYVGSLPDAENIASESLFVLWQKMQGGETVNAPLPFVFCVARNKALNLLRSRYMLGKVNGELSDEGLGEIQSRIAALDSCDPHALYSSDVQSILKDTLSKMGEKTRRIFIMSRFSGKSNREIARSFGMSEKAVEYHITRAIRAVRTSLKDYL